MAKEINSSSGIVAQSMSGETTNSENAPVTLQKSLGLFSAVAMVVGLVVGSGIFVSPVGVLDNAGSSAASLIFWVIGGLSAAIGSMSYVELGTSIPSSGGDYTYIGIAFGPVLQFIFVWAFLMIVFPIANAIIALIFANYILVPIFPDCSPPGNAVTLVAAFVIVLLSVINCVNVSWAARVQNVFLILKVIALIVISATGFVWIAQGKTQYWKSPWEGTSMQPVNWARAIYSGVFSYAGWNYLNLVMEEVKEPEKNLPRAIWISIPMIIVLYLCTNVAFFTVLSPEEMLSADAVAVTFGNKTLGVMSWIIPIFVACSTFGSLNGSIFTSSRLYYVAARKGQLPESISYVSIKWMTPVVSLMFQMVISLFCLISSDIHELINYATFFETVFVGLSVAALLYLRKKFPDMHRPLKVALFFPITFLVFVLFLLCMTLYEGAQSSLIGIAICLSALPVYVICIAWKNKPKSFRRAMKSMNIWLQKLFMCVPDEKEYLD
ncbi:Y+L amino acid transporter 2-like [Watersipora subatra]|uniref:Y+L amino acid transporter 2-like n=1 Tax=Watersipora subatra TaxID=2589382 RepID=UPI00355BFDDB